MDPHRLSSSALQKQLGSLEMMGGTIAKRGPADFGEGRCQLRGVPSFINIICCDFRRYSCRVLSEMEHLEAEPRYA